MNTVRVLERPLHLTYTHWKEENLTALDGTLEIAVSRKIAGNDVVSARYQSYSKVLGLDWKRNTSSSGSFKVVL